MNTAARKPPDARRGNYCSTPRPFRRAFAEEGGDGFLIVGLSDHGAHQGVGVAHRGADIAVEVEIGLALGLAQRFGRDAGDQVQRIGARFGDQLAWRDEAVDEADGVGLVCQELAAGEEQFHGARPADQPRQQP